MNTLTLLISTELEVIALSRVLVATNALLHVTLHGAAPRTPRSPLTNVFVSKSKRIIRSEREVLLIAGRCEKVSFQRFKLVCINTERELVMILK